MDTRYAISYCLSVNDNTEIRPWKVMQVHKPPMQTHGVNERDASSDHMSRHACPMVLDGVDADAVRKLHPSR
jgi:hypothetical protein